MGKNFFSNFKSEAPEYSNLGVCKDHPVRLASWHITDSFTNFDGTTKENLPGFSDPTEQCVLIYVSAEGNGSFIERKNGAGYIRYNELSPKQLESGRFFDIEGYACIKKGNDYVRIIDPKREEACKNIMNQLFDAFKLPEGSNVEDLDKVIEEKRTALISIDKEMYEGKEQFRVSRLRKAPDMSSLDVLG